MKVSNQLQLYHDPLPCASANFTKNALTTSFESNGGQIAARAEATLPELHLATAEPDLDIGNVETVLEALTDTCYFLESERNRYRHAALTFVIMAPEQTAEDPTTRQLIDEMTREHGTSGRTFKSALIWIVPDDTGRLMDDARKLPVQGFDQHDRPFPVDDVTWEAQGCRVDASGKVVTEERELLHCIRQA